MGFKTLDVTPLQITPITPPGKTHLVKVIQVSRTDTVASVKAQFPASSSFIAVRQYGSVASDAATTAAVTLTISNNTGTVSSGSADVKTNGATTNIVNMSNLPNLEPTPLTGDYTLTAVYAETGTASTTGGPWKFVIEFVA